MTRNAPRSQGDRLARVRIRLGGGRSGAASRSGTARGGQVRRLLLRMGITPTGGVVGMTALAGWILARALGGRAVFLMAYMALALVAGCWLLGRRRVSVSASRSDLPRRIPVGQPVEVELDLVAERSLSNVVLQDVLPPALGGPVTVPVAALPRGQKIRRGYGFYPTRRGVFEVGPLIATRIDPFALTTAQTVVAPPCQIIVHPPVERVQDRVLTRQWEDPPLRPPVSKPWPTGFEFYGMREYADGDDPRRISWRASARAFDPESGENRILVRESEQGITDRVNLLLDTNASAYPGTPSPLFETAVKVLASLAVRHLRDGLAVTVETSARRLFDGLRGEQNRVRLLDELARIDRQRVPLDRALERLLRDRHRRDLHQVVITAALDRQAAAGLRSLVRRGASVLVAVVLPARFDSAALQRAQAVGCHIVEVRPDVPLERAFRRVVRGAVAGAR